MKEYKTYQIISYVIICIIINMAGKFLATEASLPLWLDTIGTVIIAYVLGPVCGAIVGATTNIMYGVIDAAAYMYVITNILVGIIVGFSSKRGMLKTFLHTFSTGMVIAVITATVSTVVNILYFDGMTGNVWGDGVIASLGEKDFDYGFAVFAGEFYIDLVDKLFTLFTLYSIVRIYRNIRKRKSCDVEKTLMIGFGIIIASAYVINNSIVSYAEKAEDYNKYIQTVYDESNGIPGGEVNDIEQTMDGMLWIGTYGGLYQYDGNKFKLMKDFETVKNVNCLFTDEEGRLWIGTNDSGFSISANGEIVNTLDEDDGLPANSVRSITKNSNGYYYIGTADSLAMVTLTNGCEILKIFEELNYVVSMAADSRGNIVAVAADGSLNLINNETLLQSLASEGKYTCATFSPNGYIYAASSDNIIDVYVIKKNSLIKKKSLKCGELKHVKALKFSDENVLFICADNGIGYIGEDNEYHYLNTDVIGFNSSIENVIWDYQGNFWFASSRLGLLKLGKSIYEDIYSGIGIKEKVVNAITKWQGKYYVGTDEGLDIIDENLKEQYEDVLTEKLKNIRVRHLMTDRYDNMWICTSGYGVWQITKDEEIYIYDSKKGMAGDRTRAAYELENGDIAVATDTGISYLCGEGGEKEITSNITIKEGLKNEKTLCLLEAGNYLYAGSDGSGISVIKDGKVERIITRKDGIGSDIVLRLVRTADEKGIYVVTSNGISCIFDNGEVKQLSNFPYYNNFDIIPEKNGRLWVTGSAGIYVTDEKQLLSGGDIEYEIMDARKGLRQNLTANSWNYFDEAGRMFLCCDEGIVAINMQRYNDLRTSYRIMLDSLSVDGVNVNVDKEEVTKISRGAAKIELYPKIINYSMNDPYVQIQLVGFDKEPIVLLQSELDTLVYTNLPSGNYTFRLAIMDNKKEHIIEEVKYHIKKEKEIFDNWWFNIYLVGVFAIIVVYFVWMIVGSHINKSLRIQRQEMENFKLKQQAEAAVAADVAKSNFLAQMSHDIRTPINAVLGMNEMILRQSNQPEVYECAENIQSAGRTLLSLINSILDLSKIEDGKMEIIPVQYETATLISNLIHSIMDRAKEKNLEFIVDIDSGLPVEMYGDDVRITQVISNILTNAVKYTEEGSIKFTVSEQERQGDKIKLFVEVKDTGIGIREEDMGKLFESFQRLDEIRNRNIEGTGLGMSIITKLLTLMRSELHVESVYGEGSTFSFVIEQKIVLEEPIGDYTKHLYSGMDEKKNQTHIYAPDAKILVVDDNEMNLKVARGLLKGNGINPDTANSGVKALELIRNKKYHIILMDHMMPEMDGIEVLKVIRENNMITQDTVVIVLTANAINGAKEQYMAVGFDDYITKPLDVAALESKLKKYIPEELVSYKKIQCDNEVAGERANADSYSIEELIDMRERCPQLNVVAGMQYSMDSREFYESVLADYLDGDMSQELETLFEGMDISNYRIKVHALKSTSLSIGAIMLSEHARLLEMAAKTNDREYINAHHRDVMDEYKKLLDGIRSFLGK